MALLAVLPLQDILATIPVNNRHRLDEKLENCISRTTIARSLGRDWRVVAEYIPNIKNDIDGIEHDNHSLELQKMALLDMWVVRNGPWATYRQLAESLYKAKAINSLYVLCKELGAPAQLTTHTPTTPPQAPSQTPVSLPEPTMKELMKFVKTTQPYELGVQLDVNTDDLDRMRANFPTDHGRQLTEVFSLYRKQELAPSWVQVATALHTIGEINQAKTIANRFGFFLQEPEHGIGHLPLSTTMPMECEDSSSTGRIIPCGDACVRPRGKAVMTEGVNTLPDNKQTPEFKGVTPPHDKKKLLKSKNLWVLMFLGASLLLGWYFNFNVVQTPVTPPSPSIDSNTDSSYKSTKTGQRDSSDQEPDIELLSEAVFYFTDSPFARRAEATQREIPEWLKLEPTMSLLFLIKYTDSKGNDVRYRLINELQHDCRKLGRQLGINEPTLRSFDSIGVRPPEDVCGDIMDEWMKQGEGDVTWGGLLQALKDVQLSGIANHLENALTLYFKHE